MKQIKFTYIRADSDEVLWSTICQSCVTKYEVPENLLSHRNRNKKVICGVWDCRYDATYTVTLPERLKLTLVVKGDNSSIPGFKVSR